MRNFKFVKDLCTSPFYSDHSNTIYFKMSNFSSKFWKMDMIRNYKVHIFLQCVVKNTVQTKFY